MTPSFGMMFNNIFIFPVETNTHFQLHFELNKKKKHTQSEKHKEQKSSYFFHSEKLPASLIEYQIIKKKLSPVTKITSTFQLYSIFV